MLLRKRNNLIDLHGAVLASDAFFPFNDCVQIAHAAELKYIHGRFRGDKDSIDYTVENKLAMVMTGMCHSNTSKENIDNKTKAYLALVQPVLYGAPLVASKMVFKNTS